MKKTFLLIMILGFLNLCGATAQEPTQLNVLYEMQYKRDLDNAGLVVKKQMLSVANNRSRYVEQSIFNSNNKAVLEARKKQMEKILASASSNMRMVSGSPMLSITNEGVSTSEEVMTDIQNKSLSLTGNLGLKTYYYTAPIPTIKWNLQKDKKTIVGYECQKAVGNFGGRTYEVWFAAALPYTMGPWKLGGLPGLILEAKDSKNEVIFIAMEITKNTDLEELVIPYLTTNNAIKVKEKEYKETEKMLVIDPESIVSAQFPNTKVMIRNRDNPNNKEVIKVKKYNPMELR